MNLEKKTIQKILFILAFAILFFWGLNNYKGVFAFGSTLFGYIFPFLLGACIAFLLNIPLRLIEKRLTLFYAKATKGKKPSLKILRPISIILTLLLIVGIFLGVILIVIPQIKVTVLSIREALPGFGKQIQDWTTSVAVKIPDLAAQLDAMGINWQNFGKTITNFLQAFGGTVIGSSLSIANSVFSGMVNFFLATIFALYILSSKETLGRQVQLLLQAYLPAERRNKVQAVATLTNKTFTSFFTGQCTEAVILGFMFFLGMTIFKFPYAVMISVLIGFTSLIPIFGAFVGCLIGCFFILVSNPMQAVWFIVFFLVIQQIEGNLIYPKVVGGSVGLPPMWVLVAVTIGGSMMGVVGMLIFIPIVSVLYTLLREATYTRLGIRKRI